MAWLVPLFCCSAFSQPGSVTDRESAILEIQKLITQNDLVSARERATEGIAKFPTDGGFYNLLGIIDANLGNYPSAEADFRRSISRSPKFTGAYLNLGHLYLENTKLDLDAQRKALAVYAELLKFDGRNVEANYQSAFLFMKEGNYRQSLGYLSRLPAGSRGKAQALAVLCADFSALHNRQRSDEAAARLRSHPELSEADLQMILPVLASANRDDIVISLVTTLAKSRNVSGGSFRRLGLAYERTGRLVEARDALEKSFADASSASSSVLLDLARVAHQQKDYKGSLGYLAHAEDLDPKDATIPYSFGLVCLELNLVAEARKAIRKALDLEPDNPSYNYSMGAVSTFAQDAAEAIPYFEKYLTLRPADPRGKLALGAAYFRAQDYEASLPLLRESTAYSETSSAAHYYVGRILIEQHKPDAAILELQLSLKSNPDYADALAQIGHCYILKKDYPSADKNLGRALALFPMHYQANFDLLFLYTKTRDPRREAQAKRFDEIREASEKQSQEVMRILEVRPFSNSQD